MSTSSLLDLIIWTFGLDSLVLICNTHLKSRYYVWLMEFIMFSCVSVWIYVPHSHSMLFVLCILTFLLENNSFLYVELLWVFLYQLILFLSVFAIYAYYNTRYSKRFKRNDIYRVLLFWHWVVILGMYNYYVWWVKFIISY